MPDISEQELRERCARVLSGAADEAARLHHDFIGTEHLFIALTQIDGGLAHRLLILAGLDARTTRNEIRRDAGANDPPERPISAPMILTPRAQKVLAAAVELADEHGEDVDDKHLIMALLTAGVEGVPMRRLKAMGVNLEYWIEVVGEALDFGDAFNEESVSPFARREEDPPFASPFKAGRESAPPLSPFGGLFARPTFRDNPFFSGSGSHERERVTGALGTPLLDKYGRDLTALAKQGKLSPVIGREREIRSLARTLTRSKKNNPLLVGDAGVGKTAVVEGLALAIAEGTAPVTLQGKRIVQIEIGTLLAGTSLRGQFEERLVGILDEVKAARNVIVFIDEIHSIVGAGDTIDSNLDAANILKPALSRGEIMCIGATTHEEYRRAIAQDAALDRRFRTVEISEPTLDETLQIMTSVKGHYEGHHAVMIAEEALEAAARLSTQYMLNRRQPDKALDLLDEACARLVIHGGSEVGLPKVVTAATIAEVLAEWTGIPVAQISADEREKFQQMEEALKRRVIGQDHAVAAVADAIKTNRAGLSDPRRPIGAFLFLGPSGVGKTELARALTALMFGTEDALIRLDMSEFHDEHTVARLIGSPPGYKDSQKGGQLTESLRRRPYAVVLLDEVDKAAPEVFDIFLQVFDEGRLSDARGGTVDARHAIWIMTSNIGTAEGAKGAIGFSPEQGRDRAEIYQSALKKFFRPELLNRLDEVVIFNPLSREVLLDILELQIKDVRSRLREQDLTLDLTDSARDLILSQGSDSANGARPMRRAMERLLVRPLGRFLLEQAALSGQVIRADASDSRLKFELA